MQLIIGLFAASIALNVLLGVVLTFRNIAAYKRGYGHALADYQVEPIFDIGGADNG